MDQKLIDEQLKILYEAQKKAINIKVAADKPFVNIAGAHLMRAINELENYKIGPYLNQPETGDPNAADA